MAKFRYRAVLSNGRVVNGTIDDESRESVLERLKNNGLQPVSVQQSKGLGSLGNKKAKKNATTSSSASVSKYAKQKMIENQKKKEKTGLQTEIELPFEIDLSFLHRVTRKDVFSFTQSLYLLKRANFTNIRALATLLENTDNPAMRNVIEDILNGVEAGEYIYSTLEYYDKIFPDIYIETIKVGELSGSLTNALFQAMNYLETSEKRTKALKKALIGPLLQAVLMLVGTVVGIVVGVPILEDLYGSMGLTNQIPAATMAASNFIKLVVKYWYIGVAVVAGLVTAFIVWKSTIHGKYQWDMFKLKIPIFGGLILRLQLQKFFEAMQLNLANNAKLQDALEVSKGTVSNYVVLSVIETATDNLQQGDSWVEPFENLPNMPRMALEMLRIGMETDITDMINKIVEYMEDEITITIDRTIKVLPQISMTIMGIVMIVFVILVLKPIMEVYMGSFLFDAYL